MADDITTVRARLAEKLEVAAALETELGRAGFEDLPERVQSQLSVLQAQAEPKRGAGLESLLGAEHNLDAYQAKLREALDLVRQMQGERGRRRSARARRGRRWLVTAAVIGVMLVGGGVYLRQALADKAADCSDSPACVQSGLCGAAVTLKGSPRIVCAPDSDAHCGASNDCARNGRCHDAGTECAAIGDSDCEALELCQSHGFCSAVEGSCVPAKVQDCRQTPGCTERGLCTPLDGVCKAGSDADCRQSELCKRAHACAEIGGGCVRLPEEFVDGGAP